jgi:salicylic acid 3-hydroxylase
MCLNVMSACRDTIKEYFKAQEVLVRTLLELISESLGLDSGYIDNECADPRIVIAINHYPPCPDPTLTMGIREHSDPNTITILMQDQVAGLQMYKEGLWFDVKPLENALVVNVGDHLQVRFHLSFQPAL